MGLPRTVSLLGLIVVVLAGGCQSGSRPTSRSAASASASTPTTAVPGVLKPVAYINSQPVGRDELWTAMAEAGGGAVLEEIVLDRLLTDRLERQGITLNPDQIEAERQALLTTLHDDPNQALRLLNELRLRRGLGDERFSRLLRRNAGLRALTKDGIEVGDMAVRQAYDAQYGPKYEARLIVTETLQDAAEVVRRARAGESFVDLAIARSTDPSRAQGGLLDPISPADATYPQAIRTVVAKLDVGQVSDPVALEQGFAVLRLERKIDPQQVEFDDVKGELAERVRRQLERVRMQQLARTLLTEADVVVFDATLQQMWTTRKQQLLTE